MATRETTLSETTTETRARDTPPRGRRSVLAALGANLAVAASKLVGFLLTGSSAMLAEAGHSLADTANQGLLLFGQKVASEAPSGQHPFGRGRERYFWAFVVGLVLFGLGGVAAITEGVLRLRNPHDELGNIWIAVVLLLVAAVAESLSLRTGMAEARPLKGDQDWLTYLRRTKDPDTTVVIVEDTGALIGLLLALVGLVATQLTGDPRWDAAATVAIGLLLCGLAAFLTHEMHSLLVGEPATPELRARLFDAALAVPGVAEIVELRTEYLGPDELLVCARVAVDPTDQPEARVLDRARVAIEQADPGLTLCYLQPVAPPRGDQA